MIYRSSDKFTIFTRINQIPQEFASIDCCSKTDLYNFVIIEKVEFMFETRTVHITRSAPGTSQNVVAVNRDDDDSKRDCGGEKGSHGCGGSRGDNKTSSHGGQGQRNSQGYHQQSSSGGGGGCSQQRGSQSNNNRK